LKLSIIFLALLFSSFTKTSEPVTRTICGTWKGFYGTEKEIFPIVIKIDLQNKAEIFYDFVDANLKSSGSYKLLGDSAIIIYSRLSDGNSTKVILNGNLNRTSSFIDGQWDGEGKEGGCFYLQKQFPDNL
jgi:hypothetical protein